MNIKQIKALADVLKNADLTVLEVCEGETKIRLEKSPVSVTSAPVVKEASALSNVQSAPIEPAMNGAVDFNDVNEIKSPMVGVFYSAPSPESEDFVKIGSKVKKGDVLCIVEAMKLMNDIVADRDGEIVDICAENGQIIEFGQTLFKIF